MNNRNRHIASGLFGALLLLPLLAMLLLQFAQTFVQATREERLESEALVTVVLPAHEVVWEEEEKELWVGNRMFDVASYRFANGYYYLTGVYDDDETGIAGSLLHSVLTKNGSGLLHLLLLLQCFAGSVLLIETNKPVRKNRKKKPFYLSYFPSYFSQILGPPPRGLVLR